MQVADSSIAVGYLRVSTDDQKLGPEAQRAVILGWSMRENVGMAAWREDVGVSGATPLDKRPGLLAALDDMKANRAGMLVIARRDRLARDVVIAATIERTVKKLGARVVSADGTANGSEPADRFMRTVIDGAAAYELDIIRARTKAAMAVKAARGERVGAVPYGFALAEDGVRLVPVDAEQSVVRTVIEMRGNGMSFRAICRALNERGHRSRTNRPFAATQIFRIVRRIARS